MHFSEKLCESASHSSSCTYQVLDIKVRTFHDSTVLNRVLPGFLVFQDRLRLVARSRKSAG